jgi:addiction module HigA family antidote
MTDEPRNAYQPTSVTSPGATLADLLEERGIRQNELAVRMDVTPKFINELVAGKASISPTTALSLERALDLSADFWLARDARYQAYRARLAEETQLAEQRNWLAELPLKDMLTFRWIEKRDSGAERVAECLRFFRVASASAWREQYVNRVLGSAAYRMTASAKQAQGAIAAWLRQGEIEASRRECGVFSKDAFTAALQEARALTLESNPDKFIPALDALFSVCGVVVSFVRAPKGCPASGAVRWLSPEKALVQLSLRYKTNDSLWFTFFHECAHIVLHRKKLLFLEGAGMSGIQEQEANKFAGETLIPSDQWTLFKGSAHTEAEIRGFAGAVGIHPGIVLGRLHKEKLVPWNRLTHLKVRYAWKESE